MGVAALAVLDYGCSAGTIRLYLSSYIRCRLLCSHFLLYNNWCELSRRNPACYPPHAALSQAAAGSQVDASALGSLLPDTNSLRALAGCCVTRLAGNQPCRGGWGSKEFYESLSGHRDLSETSHLLIPVSMWQCWDRGSFLFPFTSVPVYMSRPTSR